MSSTFKPYISHLKNKKVTIFRQFPRNNIFKRFSYLVKEAANITLNLNIVLLLCFLLTLILFPQLKVCIFLLQLLGQKEHLKVEGFLLGKLL